MELFFAKYQGAGNDFILVDDRQGSFPWVDKQVVQALCARKLGIGADGLILLQTSQKADLRMRIFNSDGSEAAMCGNGIRCLALYAKKLGFLQDPLLIETLGRVLTCHVEGQEVVVSLSTSKVLYFPLHLQDVLEEEVFVVDTGVPHAVVFVKDLSCFPVETLVKKIRLHPFFAPEGVNVNFIHVELDGSISIRTYERGVEGETLACGTGSAAAFFICIKKGLVPTTARVMPLSQEALTFSLVPSSTGEEEIFMKGKASLVFEGRVLL